MAEMLYRKVARTGDEVGVIGMGTSSNGEAGPRRPGGRWSSLWTPA